MRIKLVHTQRVLAPTIMTLAGFTINPYRGCEFNCSYCYAKSIRIDNKNRDLLGVKINAPEILEKELNYKKIDKVVLGSNCECFTYAEIKFKLTEKILTILNNNRVAYTILTKSHLIGNYLPLIRQNKDNRIFFTFNFSREKIRSFLEEKSPSLENRLAVLERIKQSGIPLRIHIGPFIPYLSDLDEIFFRIKGLTREINIELYHSKTGNFEEVLQKVKDYDYSIAGKIRTVYENRESYRDFSRRLRIRALALNKSYGFKIYFIVPEFDEFYDSRINYENPIF